MEFCRQHFAPPRAQREKYPIFLFAALLALGVAYFPLSARAGWCPEAYAHLIPSKYPKGLRAKVESNWKQVFLDSSEAREIGANVLLRFSSSMHRKTEHALFGRLEQVELVPGYTVLKLTDPEGSAHLIDPSLVPVHSIHVGPENLGAEMLAEMRSLKRGLSVHLRPDRLRGHFCTEYAARRKSPAFEQLQRIVARSLHNYRHDSLVSLEVARCGLGMLYGTGAPFVSFATRFYFENGTWYRDHSSNFIYSLGFMAGMDQCLKQLSSSHRNSFLTAALGATMMGNIWEEVDLSSYGIENTGISVLNNAGNKVQTDLADLKAGVLGTLTYIVGIKIFEARFPGFNVARFCK